MKLIDTHTHIYDSEFDADRLAVVERAKAAGVSRLLLPNIDASSVDAMLKTAQTWPDMCRCMMGIHPTSVHADYQVQLDCFDRCMEKPYAYVAVGEIGLDLYWDKTFLREQKKVFEYQVAVAVELALPIAIHCREAFAEVVDSLKKFDKTKIRGVFHSFTGGEDQARVISSLGDFYMGIGGVCTYKNAKFTERLSAVDLSRLVLETDAPYLTPVPYRGKRNEPAYLIHVADKLAAVYGKTSEEIGQLTTRNAENLFFLGNQKNID